MVPLSVIKGKLLPLVTVTLFVFAAVLVSGFTVAEMETGVSQVSLPAAQAPVNVIVNGDFEKPWENREGVAPDWEPYSNGQAHFGWYEELWPEAVYGGSESRSSCIRPGIVAEAVVAHRYTPVADSIFWGLGFDPRFNNQTTSRKAEGENVGHALMFFISMVGSACPARFICDHATPAMAEALKRDRSFPKKAGDENNSQASLNPKGIYVAILVLKWRHE